MSMGDPRPQSLSTECAASQARHLGVGSTFIYEHQMGCGLPRQILMPARPFFGDVGTFLLGGGQSFF
jgi:phage gpG-like protein